MGIFSRHKNNLPIQLSEKHKEALIHPLSNNLSKIRIGGNLNVDEGWSVVIVAKGQPLEIFNSGQHQLSVSSMPNTTRVLKLNKGKVKKNNQDVQMVMPENFECDLYFVNLKTFDNIRWHTGKIGVRSKRYGMYRVKTSGTLSIQVTRPMDFIRLFLYQWSHIPSGKDKKYLSALLDEECQLLLTKSDFTDPNDFLDNNKIAQYLTENLNKNFSKYGIKIENIIVSNTNISGRVATMLQAEQNGDSGLTQAVEQQIDNFDASTKDSHGEAYSPADVPANDDFVPDVTSEQAKELVLVGGSAPAVDMQEKTQTTQLSDNLPDNNSNLAQFDTNFSQNTSNSSIMDVDTVRQNPQIMTEELQNYNAIKLSDNASNPVKKGKLSHKKIKNVKQNTQPDYLKEDTQPRTINIAGDVTCPKCGGILLGGLCINCERNKDDNDNN